MVCEAKYANQVNLHFRVTLASLPTWTGQWTPSIWCQIQGTMRYYTVSIFAVYGCVSI